MPWKTIKQVIKRAAFKVPMTSLDTRGADFAPDANPLEADRLSASGRLPRSYRESSRTPPFRGATRFVKRIRAPSEVIASQRDLVAAFSELPQAEAQP